MTILFVTNIDKTLLNKDKLREIFVDYGNVGKVAIKMPPHKKPFAFVTFADNESAEKAIEGKFQITLYDNSYLYII